MDFPEQTAAKIDELFESVAKRYWEIYKAEKDYRKPDDYILYTLNREERNSERFKHILLKRRPADV